MTVLGWMSFLIIMPFVTALPAVTFLAVFWFKRLKTSLIAALTWALYGVYETLMYMRVLCSGECNIRIDLLLIYPLLLLVSASAIGFLGWRLYRDRKA